MSQSRSLGVYSFPRQGRGMSDFAKKHAEEIRRAEAQAKEVDDRSYESSKVFVERENLTKKLGPDLWLSLRELIVSKCGELNRELGKEYYRCHDEMPNKLRVIRISPPANLRVEFFPDAHRIHFDSGMCSGEYLIGINETTGQAYLTDAHHSHFETELTAEYLLGECLAKAQF
jgi:hypothetical protein